MVGLWRYPIPGFFLLAQFFLGILVAVGNLVNNSVFLCLSDEENQSSNVSFSEEGTDGYFNLNQITQQCPHICLVIHSILCSTLIELAKSTLVCLQ